MCLYVILSSVVLYPLRFPHKNDVRFVFTSSWLWESSCLIYVICLFAHSGAQRILCCVCVVHVFILCTLCCQFLWMVNFELPLRYSLTFIHTYNEGNEVCLVFQLNLIHSYNSLHHCACGPYYKNI